jgi:hypothetical protein
MKIVGIEIKAMFDKQDLFIIFIHKRRNSEDLICCDFHEF